MALLGLDIGTTGSRAVLVDGDGHLLATATEPHDAHAYRTEGLEGVKDFARGCMRTYLILKDKAVRWIADPEISELVAELDRSSQPSPPIGQYSDATARALREHRFDRQALGARELAYERLDQLTIEILLGVR